MRQQPISLRISTTFVTLSGLYTVIADLCRRARGSGLARWELWHLPGRLRAYIALVHAAALTALAAALVSTRWHTRDAAVFLVIFGCAMATIEASRKIEIPHGTLFRDMRAVWYIAAAALLPPVYAVALPLVLVPVKLARMARGVTYRRVFSGSVCALAYGGMGELFGRLPHSVAGRAPGSGMHVVTWLAILAGCGALGLAANNALLIIAMKLFDPATRVRTQVFEREALITDLCQLALAVLIALPAAFSPFLLAVALPIVVVMRRFMMHAQLLTAARIDGKTGLLNSGTWQREVELEVRRAIRIGAPLAVAIADIDHFKAVNDRYGHLAGDAVLALIAAAMSALLRDYDVIGRFGGEEFAVCLPHTGPREALQVAERLREKLSQITAQDSVQVTVSVGVASMESSPRTLDELILAADTALYSAKAAGRNCVRMIRESTPVA
jgi:diguanylate cyclase (GGDEF)-like protein